jgi:hypothetical protein
MIGSAFSTAANGTETSLNGRNRLAAMAASTPRTVPGDQPDQRVHTGGQCGLPDVPALLDQLAPDGRGCRNDERRDPAQSDGQFPGDDHQHAHGDRR